MKSQQKQQKSQQKQQQPQQIKRTARAQHRRRVHVYGWRGGARGLPTGISVQIGSDDTRTAQRLRPGSAVIAWLPRGELRKVRDAISKILGDRR